MVGIICPLVRIGLTETPNSGWVKSPPSSPPANGITAVTMMILMMTMMCLCGAHACFHNFFRSSSRPQNRAAVEARSTRPTRRRAAMARRYVFIYIRMYILHMLLIYALHDSRIKKRRRRRQLWRSILESGFLSFKVSPPVLSKVPFVFLSVPHWSRKLQKYYCNAMQCHAKCQFCMNVLSQLSLLES